MCSFWLSKSALAIRFHWLVTGFFLEELRAFFNKIKMSKYRIFHKDINEFYPVHNFLIEVFPSHCVIRKNINQIQNHIPGAIVSQKILEDEIKANPNLFFVVAECTFIPIYELPISVTFDW